ncbi:MAG: hypothetical protein Q8O83_01560 [bacterium]|nr:hypothetical protein [bacterium]
MARQKVQVCLPSLCKKHGGEEEYPDLQVGELTGRTSDGGSCLEVRFPKHFKGRRMDKHGKRGPYETLTDGMNCMSIPRWLLPPVEVNATH